MVHFSKTIFILLFNCLLLTPSYCAWQNLAKGIDYIDLTPQRIKPWSHVHAFKIDLQYNVLKSSFAKDFSQKTSSVKQLAQQEHAVLAINGGFFSQKYHPLGLRISNGKTMNPLKKISWWGIFYTKGKKAFITSRHEFYKTKSIDFAIQSGPRLLINTTIPKLKPGIAERSALGITQEGKVIILATEHYPLSTTELAKIMKDPPLNCRYALNLDGGSSTQLFAQVGDFHLNASGFANVTDAVIVIPKK